MEQYSPIHHAIKATNKDMIKLLLENGAKPNSKMADRNWKGGGGSSTAFQMALKMNDPEILELFFKLGANPNTK